MLDTFITSKTRVRIMFKFFLNSKIKSYLRGLEKEFGDSTNTIRLELTRFERVGLLESEVIQNKKYYKANINHPFYSDINSILKKSVGISNIVRYLDEIDKKLEAAWVTGDIAKGTDSMIIDLVIIGKDLDYKKLARIINKIQKGITRRIRYIVLTDGQMTDYFNNKPAFCIWEKTIKGFNREI